MAPPQPPHFVLFQTQFLALAVTAVVVIAVRLLLGKLIRKLEARDIVPSHTADQLRNILNLFTILIIVISAIATVLYSAIQYIAYALLIFFAIALFCARDILSNYLSYYALVFSKIISVRDVVLLQNSNVRGKVTRVTPLYVEIKTDEGHIVRIPNAELLRTPVLIYRGLYRIDLILRIRSRERIDVRGVEDKLRELLLSYREIDKSKGPEIALRDLGENYCDIRVTVYVASPERVQDVAMDLVEKLKSVLEPLDVTVYVM